MGEVEGQVRNEELDAEREARRRLALAQVRQYPDPILRMKANDVEEIDDHRQKAFSVASGIGVEWSNEQAHEGMRRSVSALRELAGTAWPGRPA